MLLNYINLLTIFHVIQNFQLQNTINYDDLKLKLGQKLSEGAQHCIIFLPEAETQILSISLPEAKDLATSKQKTETDEMSNGETKLEVVDVHVSMDLAV